MHMHFPKALHGWREFAKEVGIIVLGVLIALTAEQSVEWLHWQVKVDESEQAIALDLALVSDLASERVAVHHCLDDRLLLLRSAIEASGVRWNTVLPASVDGMPFTFPYSVPTRLWNTQVWDSLVADGTVSHMEPMRERNYALLYNTIRLAFDDNEDEYRMRPTLNVLRDGNVPLSADGKLALIRTVDELRSENDAIYTVSRQILRRIQESGDLPTPADTKRRLSSRYSYAFLCRYAAQDLDRRVASDWFTLHR